MNYYFIIVTAYLIFLLVIFQLWLENSSKYPSSTMNAKHDKQLCRMLLRSAKVIKQYIWNVFLSADQFVNTLLAGDPDETLSSRMGKRLDTCGLCRFVCKWLDKIDDRHCHKSVEKDEGKNGII